MHKKCKTFPILPEGKQTIFLDRHILIKRSLNMIISQNKHKKVFDIYSTEFGAVMTTVLPVLFNYCYTYCYSDSRKL
jgi:isoprenylcysteine carboxyl methyltransferase (ICMT) family protein YpbQ